MGFSFFDLFRKQNGKTGYREIKCSELQEAAQEYQLRELAFWICVDMIANAIGRCEVRTFTDGKEKRGPEYWTWNLEPNGSQNAAAFRHKLVARLYQDNEALIVAKSDGKKESLFVADDFVEVQSDATLPAKYEQIKVGDTILPGTYDEKDVMHLKLNHADMRPIMNGLYDSYYRLVQAAMKNYTWNHGQHWKVTVSQIAEGQEGWEESFQKMMTAQIKPFLESNSAILPQFDGYQYENVGAEDGRQSSGDTRDIKAMFEDIFDFTARSMLIPAVLQNGKIEGTQDANSRFLTYAIDPLCDQLQQEATRKRYGYTRWKNGSYIVVDSSAVMHFDMFENASNIEKLIGSAAFSVNDVLRAAGKPTINEPWADQHWMTKNISTVTEQAIAVGAAGEGGSAE